MIKKYLNNIPQKEITASYKTFKEKYSPSKIDEIKQIKEEEYQDGFLRDIFVSVLGYTLKPDDRYDLSREFKNQSDSKKADGAILKDGKAIAVIELKSNKTKILKSITEQAFNYKNNQPECKYVITSNFRKLRFYIDYAGEYEEFNLFNLKIEDFQLFYLILSKNSLFTDIPIKLKKESIYHEQDVSNRLYKEYSVFKNDLFQNLIKNNPENDKLTLFKKSQKLIDRFLFIFFAEDRGLLPPNSIDRIIERFNILKDEDAYKPLYDIYKQYFGYMNIGRKGKTPNDDIPAYNGGLFAPDVVLDALIIDDGVLVKDLRKFSAYDFNTEVDVNVLGHIFEHSLSEIEEITATIAGTTINKNKSKRKKDGIFYTPKYITQYIVENTVGTLCEEKRKELDITEIEIDESHHNKAGKLSAKGKDLQGKIEDYKKWLLSLKIVDPACGSGAFLNQALNFLIDEHKLIFELETDLQKGQIPLFNIETHILENNLYGVDINEESIEIAKLSLWLRTAKKGRKLSSLNNNIKCGNSLIDDSKIAGEKAFNWQKEFPDVMKDGGFDVVIGNPPYGILIDSKMKKYYDKQFPLTNYKINLYVLFIERMMQIFKKGIFHFIIPKSLLFNSYYENIRRHLIQNTEVNEILTITEKVFEDAEVGSSLILRFTVKNKRQSDNLVKLVAVEKIEDFIKMVNLTENKMPQSTFLDVPNCEISIVSASLQGVLSKLKTHKIIRNYYSLKNGLNPGNIKHILISNKKETKNHKPIIWGKEISRYNIQWGGDYVHYDQNIINKITLDDVKSKNGMNKQRRIDFALRTPDLFENKKIVIRKTGDSLIACLDENNFYFDTLVHGIYSIDSKFTEEYLLAILNSKPATLFYRLLHDIQGKVFAKISLNNLAAFPIPKATSAQIQDLSDKASSLLSMTSDLMKESLTFQKLLKSSLGLQKINKKLTTHWELDWETFEAELRKQKKKIPLKEKREWIELFEDQKKKSGTLKRQIDLETMEIDQLVYKLYDLTDEEIKVVNGEA
ncbi:MAG: TaqI-like C-terminal specificity domain-containing protein [Candidatus Tenebribacter burtonii]|nr:TaqI-like C-terminal specificity domain-containing protein [Candidatus Tenebribacter burtonii]